MISAFSLGMITHLVACFIQKAREGKSKRDKEKKLTKRIMNKKEN